jgi:hypothetical protein
VNIRVDDRVCQVADMNVVVAVRMLVSICNVVSTIRRRNAEVGDIRAKARLGFV